MWFVGFISLLAVGAIETAALGQPQPVGLHSHPHGVKGVIRYFTEGQERIYQVAYPSMIAAFPAMFILFGICSSLETGLSKQRRQVVLENFARSFDEQAEP